MEQQFEKASRMKLGFETPMGILAVDDLWDLPLTSKTGRANLDDIWKALNKQIKAGADESYVNKSAKSDEVTQLRFDIVKHIIDVRLAENEAANRAKENKERKQQILQIIAQKEVAALGEKSIDDLKKIAEAM